MGWLRREVERALEGHRSLASAAAEQEQRRKAIANFQDLGEQAMKMSRFGDHGMPQWVEEHHSLPVAPLLTTQGLAHRGPHAEAPDPVGLNGPDAEAIYIACLNGDVEALRPLLAKFLPAESEEAAAEPAADAEAPAAGRRWQLVDRYGWEPPAIATAGGHLETLKLLLEAGCEADARNKYSGRSALHRCALIPWGGRLTEDARPCNKAFAAPVVMPRPPPHALS